MLRRDRLLAVFSLMVLSIILGMRGSILESVLAAPVIIFGLVELDVYFERRCDASANQLAKALTEEVPQTGDLRS